MKARRSFPLHPLFFAVQPILFLLTQNLDEASLADTAKPIVISLIATLLLLGIARLVLKGANKAHLLVTLFLILFFSYGHVFRLTYGRSIAGFAYGRTLVLYPLYCLCIAVAAVAIARTKRPLETANRYLSVLGVLLVAMCIVQITAYSMNPARQSTSIWNKFVDSYCREHPLKAADGSKLPDIYYIVLDNYSRSDVLKEELGFDNSKFIHYLKNKGFYVADRSMSRYLTTNISLPASLNFEYLDELARESKVPHSGTRCRLDMIAKCRTAQLLKNAGYRILSFPSGYSVTGNISADTKFQRNWLSMSEFDRSLVSSTMLFAPDAIMPVHRFSSRGELDDYRGNITFTFDKLAQVPDIKEPTFAFAHILATHPPFVFDADGNIPSVSLDSLIVGNQLKSYDRRLYTDSISYVNQQTRRVIDRILAKSKTPPIIIIQADHGLSNPIDGVGLLPPRRRSGILNAYYLPNGGERAVYSSINPVNSFRALFNYYFGAHFELLKDEYPADSGGAEQTDDAVAR